MSSRCCYCEPLPAIRAGAGRPAKCPACKGGLVIARRNGNTYRLAEPGEAVAGGRRGLVIGGTAATMLLAAILVTAVLVHRAETPARDGGPSCLKVLSPVQPETRETPAPLPPVATAPAAPAPEVVRAQGKLAPRKETTLAWVKLPPTKRLATALDAPQKTPEQQKAELQARVRATVELSAKHQQSRTAEVLREQLLKDVPEVALETDAAPTKGTDAKAARQHIQAQANAIAKQITSNPDAFVMHLKEKREDLAGLPWRMGQDCRLTGTAGYELESRSRLIRTALDGSLVASKKSLQKQTKPVPDAPLHESELFWTTLQKNGNGLYDHGAGLSALRQMLAVKDPGLRFSFIKRLNETSRSEAVRNLAEAAVFDLDPEVRGAAVVGLHGRPAKEFLPVLLDGLRHPWPAAAEHAAEALAALGTTEAVPHLVALLGEPDPDAPFQQRVANRRVLVKRELVRVNHLRNCLLCHSPSTAKTDHVRAPVPPPGEEVPERSSIYYMERSGYTLVRADVTYLRQDFSVLQPVKDHGVWPAWQRFDYLVRVRPLTAEEQVAFAAERPETRPLSAHRKAILFALRALTGRDAGTTAEQWRALLDPQPLERTQIKQGPGSRQWKTPCL